MEVGKLRWHDGRVSAAICPMCGNRATKSHVVSTLNPLDGIQLDFWSCDGCGGKFPDPYAYPDVYADEESRNFWKFYVEVGAGVDFFIDILAQFKGDPGVRSFLDVGCGFGYTLDYVCRLTGWEAAGIEPGLYGHLGAEKLGVPIDFALLGSGSRYDQQQFDLVFSSEVLEHVGAPDDYLRLLCDATASGGRAVITTPAAEYIAPDHWVEQVTASLSPGYHAFLYSQAGLDRAMRAAGFSDVIVHRRADRLIAIGVRGGSLPAFDPSLRFVEEQLRYGDALLGSRVDPSIRLGAGFRLFKELVNRGEFDEAERVLSVLRALVQDVHGEGVFSDADISELAGLAADFDAYGDRAPYFLAPFLFYWGMLFLNTGRAPRAVELFRQAEMIALADIDRPHARFIESASLLWPIKLHRGISLLRTERREEALAQFYEIILFREAPHYPWTRSELAEFLVSRALKEAGVALLQLNRLPEAARMFSSGLARPEELENAGLHAELRGLLALTSA